MSQIVFWINLNFLQIQIRPRMFKMSIKREIRRLASFSRAVTAKKCTKRPDASAKLLVC